MSKRHKKNRTKAHKASRAEIVAIYEYVDSSNPDKSDAYVLQLAADMAGCDVCDVAEALCEGTE